MSESRAENTRMVKWKETIHRIIFETDTFYGKLFDIGLIIAIFLSLIGMMLESVKSINVLYGTELKIIDWVITIFFTIEYILRIITTGKPSKYIFSFYGIVDLLSIVPTYLAVFIGGGASALSVIRAIRLLRIFRVLKLVQFVGEAEKLIASIKASLKKITIFILFIITLCMILGSLMFLIEGPENGFTSIPRSIYWCIVTITTVGYGDIAPQTEIGQLLASVIMLLGYGVIAVPTGIISAEIVTSSSKANKEQKFSTRTCLECSSESHHPEAIFCKDCGAKL